MLAAMLLEWVVFQLDGPAQILVVELNRPADDLLITPLRSSENVGLLALFLCRLLSLGSCARVTVSATFF